MAMPGVTFLVGPATYTNDLGLQRTVSFKERYQLQFTAEAFNLFNTAIRFAKTTKQGCRLPA
jgi:hypothetical protein